jgi:hypothetical protein
VVNDFHKKWTIEPKLTADLHGFGSATGRLRVQASLYAQGIFKSYRAEQPVPAAVIDGEALPSAEDALLRHYGEADAAFTMHWWNRMYGRPVLVNRLTRAEYMGYNDLIRPETLVAMTRPKWGIESLRVRTYR